MTYMSLKETKAELGISGTCFWGVIHRAVRAGVLHPKRYSKKLWIFPKDEVLALSDHYTITEASDLNRLSDGRGALNKAALEARA